MCSLWYCPNSGLLLQVKNRPLTWPKKRRSSGDSNPGLLDPGKIHVYMQYGSQGSIGNDRNEFISAENVGIDTTIICIAGRAKFHIMAAIFDLSKRSRVPAWHQTNSWSGGSIDENLQKKHCGYFTARLGHKSLFGCRTNRKSQNVSGGAVITVQGTPISMIY